ncbi:M13 family metallopeptidase [Candidatus Saccharibacteria bacterium]|nr:M13 family metallopeptidase [Candidatus Saccharibacteria bacterium]
MSKTTLDLPDYVKLNDRIRPQDDFYAYACHQWCQDNPMPATHSRWGLFTTLRNRVEDQVEAILNEWLKAAPDTLEPEQRQAVAYYQALIGKDSCQDASLATLRGRIDMVTGAKLDKAGLAALLAQTRDWGLDAFFDTYAELDSKNNKRYCLTIDAANLDLPNRDYYLSRQARMKKIRQAYLDFLRRLSAELAELGLKLPLPAESVLEIETFLAGVSWPLHKERDLEKTYNLYNWSELVGKFDFDWPAYCEAVGIKSGCDVIVTQPDCLEKTLAYLTELPAERLRGYLIHKLVLGFAGVINERLAELCFDFFGRILSGTEEMKPPAKRTADSTNQAFCDTLGRAYVSRHFQAGHKQQVEDMAGQVAAAFRKRLGENAWMSAPSRLYAQEKLDEIIINAGYSDFWSDYSELKMTAGNPLANALQIVAYNVRKNLDLLGNRPDRRRFGSIVENVQTVNAWTNPILLNTNYPAAFLQPPFFDRKASRAYNLGALGSVIGHELTHNFDDQGSRYDRDGHLSPWLNREERRAFKKAADKLVKLADQHHPVPDVRMKGKQTIGELIADLGGLEIVLDVVKEVFRDDKEERQRALREVFIAYGFRWAANETNETKVMLAKAGVHPDNPFRVNGIVRHCDDFYEVFDVQEGDNLYLKPEDRVRIW